MQNVSLATPLQAQSLAINPLYLMIPATVAASLAFMLPVATPPNAIAFSYGFIKVHEMVRVWPTVCTLKQCMLVQCVEYGCSVD